MLCDRKWRAPGFQKNQSSLLQLERVGPDAIPHFLRSSSLDIEIRTETIAVIKKRLKIVEASSVGQDGLLQLQMTHQPFKRPTHFHRHELRCMLSHWQGHRKETQHRERHPQKILNVKTRPSTLKRRNYGSDRHYSNHAGPQWMPVPWYDRSKARSGWGSTCLCNLQRRCQWQRVWRQWEIFCSHRPGRGSDFAALGHELS